MKRIVYKHLPEMCIIHIHKTLSSMNPFDQGRHLTCKYPSDLGTHYMVGQVAQSVTEMPQASRGKVRRGDPVAPTP